MKSVVNVNTIENITNIETLENNCQKYILGCNILYIKLFIFNKTFIKNKKKIIFERYIHVCASG